MDNNHYKSSLTLDTGNDYEPFEIMRAKRLEHLQYRSDRIYANNIADITTFGMLVFVGFLIFLRIIGG